MSTTLRNGNGVAVTLTPKEEEQLAEIRKPRDEAMRVYTQRWLLLFEQAAQRQKINTALDAVGIGR